MQNYQSNLEQSVTLSGVGHQDSDLKREDLKIGTILYRKYSEIDNLKRELDYAVKVLNPFISSIKERTGVIVPKSIFTTINTMYRDRINLNAIGEFLENKAQKELEKEIKFHRFFANQVMNESADEYNSIEKIYINEINDIIRFYNGIDIFDLLSYSAGVFAIDMKAYDDIIENRYVFRIKTEEQLTFTNKLFDLIDTAKDAMFFFNKYSTLYKIGKVDGVEVEKVPYNINSLSVFCKTFVGNDNFNYFFPSIIK